MVDSNITEISETSLANTLLTIGVQLRAARKESGRSVADIANQLRINSGYVNAIEKGDLEALPSSTYVAGFLRSYGNIVDLDGNELARTYLARVDDADRQPTYSFPQNNVKPQRSGALIASITVVLAVAGYVGWYWTETKSDKSNDGAAILASAPVMPEAGPGVAGIGTPDVIEPDGTAQTVFAEGQDETPLSVDVNSSNPAIDAPTVIEPVADVIVPETPKIENDADADNIVVAADPVVVASVSNETIIKTDTPIVDIDTPDTQMASNNVPAVSSATSDDDRAILLEDDPNNVTQSSAVANQRDPMQEITIRATSSSWVEIIRNNGEEVMTQLMRDGDTYVVDGAENLYLSTGNAGGIEFIITGDDAISAGAIGEIVRDLPLTVDKLRARL
ncbi:helix-turn-helix domain-containing protein [Candidatus Puniceispirillum sp.]|uniref:helix-turn-helix domain-containing protein n=1 Tax=Candidatus Puniceispirillum sp. TaxID=2026719 RepID=UPI003F695459